MSAHLVLRVHSTVLFDTSDLSRINSGIVGLLLRSPALRRIFNPFLSLNPLSVRSPSTCRTTVSASHYEHRSTVWLQHFSWTIYQVNSCSPNWNSSLLRSTRSAVLLATHRSGRCLRFGFVMFPTEQEADEAVRSLSGVQLNGCSIRLSKRITADVEAEAV